MPKGIERERSARRQEREEESGAGNVCKLGGRERERGMSFSGIYFSCPDSISGLDFVNAVKYVCWVVCRI